MDPQHELMLRSDLCIFYIHECVYLVTSSAEQVFWYLYDALFMRRVIYSIDIYSAGLMSSMIAGVSFRSDKPSNSIINTKPSWCD